MNLPTMLEAAQQPGGQYDYVLPVASTLKGEWLREQLRAANVPVKLSTNSRLTLKHSHAAIVASGTATVEAALAGTPFVVVYRLAPLTWLFGRRLVKLDTFAMANLIAGRKIVTELIQHDFTAENLVREMNSILTDGPRRQQMLADLKEVQQRLRDNTSGEQPAMRAAKEILGALAATK